MSTEVSMRMSAVSVGTWPVLQFVGSFQFPVVPPIQDICAEAEHVHIIKKKRKETIIGKFQRTISRLDISVLQLGK